MSSFNLAVTIVVIGCLAMLYFVKWWNKHHNK
jgi:hypothetical protein